MNDKEREFFEKARHAELSAESAIEIERIQAEAKARESQRKAQAERGAAERQQLAKEADAKRRQLEAKQPRKDSPIAFVVITCLLMVMLEAAGCATVVVYLFGIFFCLAGAMSKLWDIGNTLRCIEFNSRKGTEK